MTPSKPLSNLPAPDPPDAPATPPRTAPVPSTLDQPLVIPEDARQALPDLPTPRPARQPARVRVRVSSQLDNVLASLLAQTDLPASQVERRDVNALVHRVLIIGLAISSVLMVAGLLLDVWLNRQVPTAVPSISEAISRVLTGRPSGLLALGLLVLIATPIVRVLGAVVAFAYARDWRYAAISLTVLVIVITSVLLGRG